ncbi:sensor histidine kinase [Plantactinospora sp. B5E13]|uniref:sensor histidine kinase n=1 Tax=Plantactinospora sp. B5E13 TaxID=3153758 RepID=UPI00325D6283
MTVLVVASAVTSPPGRIRLDLVSSFLLVVPAMATAARRRLPLVVLGLATVCVLVYQLRGYPGVAPALTVMVALYTAVKGGHRLPAGSAVVVILVGGSANELASVDAGGLAPDVVQRWLLLIGWMVAACVAGELSRQRVVHLTHVEQRALDAERTREETARRRATEERLRIARDLHDSLTHSISLINLQASVAVHLAQKRAEPVPEALVTIQEASREALQELRATLKVMRTDDAPAGGGLDRLDRLVEGARRAGIPVTVTVTGRLRSLPAPVDRAAYRIVQEALTNVTRHAGPATASVRLRYGDDALAVHIDDDGLATGRAAAVPGAGLVGMRERVTALGGSLHAGHRDGGGFTVQATLPLERPSPALDGPPSQLERSS